MYKHARGQKATPPRITVRESPLERQQRLLEKFLLALAIAELRNSKPPRMPRYQIAKYKLAIEREGSIADWARKRPEWDKVLQKAKRRLKREKRGKSINAQTRGVGKKPSHKRAKKHRRT